MTLRSRLTVVLATLVFLPLAAAAVFVGVVVPQAARERAESSLDAARSAVGAALATECERATVGSRSLARDLAGHTPGEAVRGVVRDGIADYTALVAKDGTVVASAGRVTAPAAQVRAGDCEAGSASGAAVTAQQHLVVADRPGLAVALAAQDVSGPWLAGVRGTLGVAPGVALVAQGTVVASSSPDPAAVRQAPAYAQRVPGDQALRVDGLLVAVQHARPGQPFDVVVTTDAPSGMLLYETVGLVTVFAVVLAVAFVRWLSRDLTRPLDELTVAVEAVAAGDLSRRIDVRSADEVGRLSTAFNNMSDELRSYLSALEDSRDLLRANLERLGEALSATHDMGTLLPVVLETAMSSVGAPSGLVLLGGDGPALTVHAEHGMRTRRLAVPEVVVPGEGVLGRVAASGRPIRGRMGHERGDLRAAPGEPESGEVLAVPLRRAPNVHGVLALYRPEGAEPFAQADVDALRTLAGQAAIAVQNVLFHAEAERASITDPLTGLWNFRYLSMSLNREIERASRFDRPMAVLMLDLDHFKAVNDTYGHARGDAVLREMAQRVSRRTREVDTFARYGGEEFVLVLPETSMRGAVTLAERVCAAIREAPFGQPGEEPLTLTTSVGVAVFPHHGRTATELLRAADTALYQAKAAGRDRIVLAEVTAGPARTETPSR